MPRLKLRKAEPMQYLHNRMKHRFKPLRSRARWGRRAHSYLVSRGKRK